MLRYPVLGQRNMLGPAIIRFNVYQRYSFWMKRHWNLVNVSINKQTISQCDSDRIIGVWPNIGIFTLNLLSKSTSSLTMKNSYHPVLEYQSEEIEMTLVCLFVCLFFLNTPVEVEAKVTEFGVASRPTGARGTECPTWQRKICQKEGKLQEKLGKKRGNLQKLKHTPTSLKIVSNQFVLS